MKIADVDTHKFFNWLIVRITADNGVTGIGQTAYWGYQEACEEIIQSLRPLLLGEDPLKIEWHWHRMFQWKAFRDSALMGAISAIDIALWDLAGHALELPVWQLLGGRQRTQARLHTLVEGDTPTELANAATAAAGKALPRSSWTRSQTAQSKPNQQEATCSTRSLTV